MTNVITELNQVTPAWLTAVLTQNGALQAGHVTAIETADGRGNWSQNGVLKIQYSDDALGERPLTLFLKLVDTDTGDGEYFDDSEVTYYTRDYVGVENAPLIRCYEGAYAAEQMRYHLLLEDLSDTHEECRYKEPTLEYGEALAEGLAVLHAHWWGAERLTTAVAPIHPPEFMQRFVDIAAPGVEPIISHHAADLKPHWPALMREIYAHHPQALIDRTKNAHGFTLIHGDVNPSNILAPKRGERPLYIIDRQPFDWSLTTWLGVYDLAYAMVLYWETDKRRELERPILRHYHEQLYQHGVQDYSWEQLWDDYRLCVAMGVYIATEWCRGGDTERWREIWMFELRRSLTACDDLACAELWRPVASA
ncbi:MAG: phosphotransferase [Anaerolineales bacterium]|nr:phosphotransferase [Anaerolineales bacterium]